MKIIALLFLMLSGLVQAGQSDIKVLEKFLAKASNFQADFTQTSLDEKGKAGQQSKGIFYLQQPGKFRWNYLKPYAQQIVSKGGKVWFYDADLEQVIIKKIDQSIGDTPALLLSGSVKLKEKFTISSDGLKKGALWLKLTPKNPESSFKYILIGLKEGILYGMELSDNFGQLTQIMFTNVKVPAKLDAGLFEFVPPKGTDIFEG